MGANMQSGFSFPWATWRCPASGLMLWSRALHCGRRQIGLGQQQGIGHCDLFHRLMQQRVDDGSRVGATGCFNDHPIEPTASATREAPAGVAQCIHEIVTYGATQATVIQRYGDILVILYQQQVIQRDFTKLIDDHQRSVGGRLLQQVLQYRGLAAAQKTCQQCDRDAEIVTVVLH